MAAKLTDELRQALEQQGHHPVEVIDPKSNKVYFLIDREHYQRLKPLFEDERLSDEEQKELRRQAGRRAGWDDPEMDNYDHYDEHRSQQP